MTDTLGALDADEGGLGGGTGFGPGPAHIETPGSGPESDREFTIGTRSRRSVVFHRFLKHRAASAAAIIFLLLVIFAFIGPMFWTLGIGPDYDALLPPSAAHPFGTEDLGRDMLAVIMKGTQFSLLIAVVVAIVSTLIGVTFGAIAGYAGGALDTFMNRFIELILVIPGIVLVGVLATRFHGSWIMVALFLGLVGWMGIARIIRGMVLSLREKEYVEAARALGASKSRIIFKHIVPNTADVIIVNATLTISAAILIEAALSFIGLGVKPPDTSLGLLINDTQRSCRPAAWLFWSPSGSS